MTPSDLKNVKNHHSSTWEYLKQQKRFPKGYVSPEKITAKSYDELPPYYQNMLSEMNDNINYYNRTVTREKEESQKWIWGLGLVGGAFFLTTEPLTGLGLLCAAAGLNSSNNKGYYDSHIQALTELQEQHPELEQSIKDQEKIKKLETREKIYFTGMVLSLLCAAALLYKDYKNYPVSSLILGTSYLAYQLAENRRKHQIRQAKARVIPKNVRKAYWQDFIREA